MSFPYRHFIHQPGHFLPRRLLADQIPIHLLRTPFHRSEKLYRLSTLWALAVWPWQLRTPFDLLYSLECTGVNRFLKRFLKAEAKVIYNYVGAPREASQTFPEPVLAPLDGIVVEAETQAAALRAVGVTCPLRILPHLGHIDSKPRELQSVAPDQRLQLACLGRLDRQKGIYRLLDYWPRLDIGLAALTFYGHGPEEKNLHREIRKRGLQDQVRLGGRWDSTAELSQILDRTHLLLHASEVEGLSMVLLGSMAQGVPFVGSNVGATLELARHNPDVSVVALLEEPFIEAVHSMVRRLRAGEIDGRRLQEYHRRNYGYAILARGWAEALLEPDSWIP